MPFVQIVPEDHATGAVAQIYETDRGIFGELPNLTRAFSLQPEVYAGWRQLNGAIKAGMNLCRYELATLAAARRLRSSYCSLAHGQILAKQFMAPDTVREIMSDPRAAGLDDVDVAVMDLADKVAADATSVEQADIDRLRQLGLDDREITGVVLAAAARCFFSKTLDALGAEPDAKFAAMDPPELRDALTVGRAIES